jgi:hypothetical protein
MCLAKCDWEQSVNNGSQYMHNLGRVRIIYFVIANWFRLEHFIYQHQYSTGYIIIEAGCYSGEGREHG